MIPRDVYRYVTYFLAVLLVTVPHYTWQLSPHQYLRIPLQPVYGSIEWTSDQYHTFTQFMGARSHLLDRLTDIKSENRRLREQNRSLQLVEQSYQRLRKETRLPSDTNTRRPHAVEVFRSHLTEWERTVDINQGMSDGLEQGDPVLNIVNDTWVLFGEVYETHQNWSRIIVSSDPRFKIGIVIEGVPARQFVARGSGYDGLKINHFPRVVEVPLNASVRTAPASTIAPAGLRVGSVSQLARAQVRPRTGTELWIEPTMAGQIPGVLWVLSND